MTAAKVTGHHGGIRAGLLAVTYLASAVLIAEGAVGLASDGGFPRPASSRPRASAEATVPPPDFQTASRTVTIGRSIEGREITASVFGSGPRRVLVLGGVHGDEFGDDVARDFEGYLRYHPRTAPEGTTVYVVAALNPDGAAADRGTNAANVDINRNFPAHNWRPGRSPHGRLFGSRPASEPETRALMSLLAVGFDRVISLHSTGPLVDYDGPGSRSIASAVGREMNMPVRQLHYAPVNSGSLGWYVPERYGIPLVTVELEARRLNGRVLSGMLEFVGR